MGNNLCDGSAVQNLLAIQDWQSSPIMRSRVYECDEMRLCQAKRAAILIEQALMQYIYSIIKKRLEEGHAAAAAIRLSRRTIFTK
jgi:hypothetical protein